MAALNLLNVKDDKDLEKSCDIAVRMLDSLIDYQNYFVKAASNFATKRRSLGIGITNLAACLAREGLKYWDKNLTKVFIKRRDIQIADSILELFRRSEYVENFNKKHLYLLIREMTDCKTHYITKVVNVMKTHQKRMLNEYLEHGNIEDKEEYFWTDENN